MNECALLCAQHPVPMAISSTEGRYGIIYGIKDMVSKGMWRGVCCTEI